MQKSVKKLAMLAGMTVLLVTPILSMQATAEQYFTSYQVPTSGSNPSDIVAGSQGNLWFSERLGTNVGRVTPDGTVTEYAVPSGSYSISTARGNDGNVWFTESGGHYIGKVTSDGAVSEYAIPSGSTVWSDIVAGPDGALWFSDWFDGGYKIGRVTTGGVFTGYPAPGNVNNMAVGSDGAIWMTRSVNGSDSIGRITMDGTFTQYPLPDNVNPQDIVAGPDGALWFVEYSINSVGRITTSGVITQYPLPANNNGPYTLTTGSDGALWVAAQSSNTILRMSTDGVVTSQYDAPYNSSIAAITTGPDGALWFTAPGSSSIVRFNLPVASQLVLVPVNGTNTVGSTATFQAKATNILGNPVANATVRFAVDGSITTDGSCVTDSTGACAFTYSGPQLPGADAVSAYVDTNVNGVQDQSEPAATATQAWLLPTTTDGQVTGGGHVASGTSQSDIAFGFVAKSDSGGVSGQCTVVDPAHSVKLKCTDATVVIRNGDSATVFGDATVNGQQTTYRIDIDDVATPGSGNDTFTIATQSGYSASGTLTGGNIRVH